MRGARGPVTLENVQTGDGRVFAPGAVEWADLPLPLAWLRDGDQHISLTEVAPQIGTIDTLVREGDAIMGTYSIDDENDDGAEVVRRLEAGSAPLGSRFPISIDPDNWEVEIVATESGDDEGIVILAASGEGPLTVESVRAALRAALRAAAGDPDPGQGGGEEGVVLFEDTVDAILERYTRIRIRGATLCAVAAFDGAWVELTNEAVASEPSDDDAPAEETVAAALTIPARPPADWFDLAEPAAGDERLIEQLDGGWAVPLTITDDGQVFGHLARFSQGHRGYVGRHVPPPSSATGYREFHVGTVVCEDGSQVNVGPLVVAADHAPESMRLLQARDHYANSALGWADVRVVDGEFGPWACGALRPGLTDDDLRVLRALSLSGDWRAQNGHLELISALAVNAPGFPVAREAMAASALVASGLAPARQMPGMHVVDGEVITLVAAGVVVRCSECAERERERQELTAALAATDGVMGLLHELRDGLARVERRTRHLEPIAASAFLERVHANGR